MLNLNVGVLADSRWDDDEAMDVEYNTNEMSTPMVSLEPIGDMVSGGDTMDRRNSAKKMALQKFIVPYEVKKLAFMTMGKDWREHKVQKRKVIDIEDDLEQALTNFPEDAPYDQWEVFAEQCTTSEYKETRRKYIEVRKNHKLPHGCSCIGYPRLKHKMDQIDAGEVDLTVLFGPERTGRVNQISAQDETTLLESNRLASSKIPLGKDSTGETFPKKFWWYAGLISDQTSKRLNIYCDFQLFIQSSSRCDKILGIASEEFGNIDPYSIYSPSCTGK
ncbi:hypothetical protein GIB67_007841, partial [Kingdonia uniflora]